MDWRATAIAVTFAALPLAASPTTATSAPGARPVHRPAPRPGRIHPRTPSTYCTGFGIFAFLGGGAAGTAGGEKSGILAGDSNQACGQFDGIAAGLFNVSTGAGQASFIGAGSDNYVSGKSAFSGAGNSIEALVDDGADVAGQSNGALGKSGLVGAGANNYVDGADAFVGAGNAANAQAGSFIGAGAGTNSGEYSGVGAGDGNAAGALQSFVGAGQNNLAGLLISKATGEFAGAGSSNSVRGNNSFVGAGTGNKTLADNAFVGAGGTNTAGASGFVGAGSANTAGPSSFVGSGYENAASGIGAFVGAGGMAFFQAGSPEANTAAATDAFVGAGDENLAHAAQSVVGGGVGNSIGAVDSVIGGGFENVIEAAASGDATHAVIAGGAMNVVTGATAAIGGGVQNTAAGSYATVPGGFENSASGIGSFAAGTKAVALHAGTFVWSDDAGSAKLSSTAPYQFRARASGGFYLLSNATATAGVTLAPGSGAWASLSDRNMKTTILPLNGAAVLDKVVSLPVSEWSYTSERGVRHVGPMAQDFYVAFDVGEDDRHIAAIDEDGVALAAIKSLYAKSERNNATALRENEALAAHLSQERRELAALAAKVDSLEKR